MPVKSLANARGSGCTITIAACAQFERDREGASFQRRVSDASDFRAHYRRCSLNPHGAGELPADWHVID
jgi:hypothetical protein